MAAALPDNSHMELGAVYSEPGCINRKVQTWMKDAEGRKVGEKKIPHMSVFNKRPYYPPMFSPPSPKKNPYKSCLKQR